MQGARQETQRRTLEWRPSVAPALTLSLLMAFAFRGALAGRLFYLRDISQNHFPLRQLVTERLASGQLPLWNPYHGGGTPLLANPDNLVLHPISALFMVLPFEAAFTASIVMQYALLACGAYLLARALPVGRPAATLAAVMLAFSGPAASLASMHNALSAVAWVPIALWAWLRGLEPGRRWMLPVASACFAVVLIAAEAASAASFIVLALVLGLTPDTGNRRVAPARRVVASLALVMALAAAMAAMQIVPAAELLSLSPRGGGFSAADALKWSLDPLRLPEMVLPQLFGDPTHLSPEAWWGGWLFEDGYPFLISIYVGIMPCLLMLAGLVRRGSGRMRRHGLAAAGALFLLLALGANSVLYRGLFTFVEPLRSLRYPERFLLAALLSGGLLAAIGLDGLARQRRDGRRLAGGFVSAAVIAFAAVTVLAAWPPAADRFLEMVAAVPSALLDSGSGSVLRGKLLQSFLWMFAETLLLATVTIVAVGRVPGIPAVIREWVVVAAAGVSMTLAAAPALSTAAPGWLRAPSPLAGFVGHGPSAARLYHLPRPPGLSVWGKTDELIWGFRFDRFAYALATGYPEGVPTVLEAATDRMDLRGSPELGNLLPDLTLEARLKILSIAHAGVLLSYDRVEHANLEEGPVLEGLSRPPLRAYRLRSVLPRVRFVTRRRAPAVPGDAALSLADPRFDPRSSVLVEGAGDGAAALAPQEEGHVETVIEAPERLKYAVDAPVAGYLVISDSYAPGWHARLDGASVPIQRANFLFRAVPVPQGRHEVDMNYLPASVVSGFAISAAAWLAAAVCGVWMRRRSV